VGAIKLTRLVPVFFKYPQNKSQLQEAHAFPVSVNVIKLEAELGSKMVNSMLNARRGGFITMHHPVKATASDVSFETCSGGQFSRACSGTQKSSPLLQEAFSLAKETSVAICIKHLSCMCVHPCTLNNPAADLQKVVPFSRAPCSHT